MQIEFPGLFDLQVNGFGGVDFNSPLATPEEVHRAIEQLRERGVTRFLPTLCTSSFERFAKCAKTLIQTPHPAMVGLHMEGPYIPPEDGARGAHPRPPNAMLSPARCGLASFGESHLTCATNG